MLTGKYRLRNSTFPFRNVEILGRNFDCVIVNILEKSIFLAIRAYFTSSRPLQIYVVLKQQPRNTFVLVLDDAYKVFRYLRRSNWSQLTV